MFGMSFGEMMVLGVVALVVVGPRNLPSLLRATGQLIGKVRRMANELRVESGIDEIIDAEGIRSEIDNFRRLASGAISPDDLSPNVVPDREREYPRVGPDSYGAFSEDLVPYLPADLPSLAAGGSTGGGGDYGSGTTEAQNLAPTDTHPTSPGSPPPAVASLPSPTPTTASPSTNGAGIKS